MYNLQILGPQASPALPELQRRMTDRGKPWRASLAMQFYTDIEGPACVSALVSALGSTNANCRQSAAFYLATLGTNGVPAVPILRNALNDPDPVVRRFAGAALSIILPQTTAAGCRKTPVTVRIPRGSCTRLLLLDT